LEFYAPPLTDEDFNKPVGKFSQTIFLRNCSRALTATSIGNVILWDANKYVTLGKAIYYHLHCGSKYVNKNDNIIRYMPTICYTLK